MTEFFISVLFLLITIFFSHLHYISIAYYYHYIHLGAKSVLFFRWYFACVGLWCPVKWIDWTFYGLFLSSVKKSFTTMVTYGTAQHNAVRILRPFPFSLFLSLSLTRTQQNTTSCHRNIEALKIHAQTFVSNFRSI